MNDGPQTIFLVDSDGKALKKKGSGRGEKTVAEKLCRSHPLFAASCTDGLVVASLEPCTMRHTRIIPLLGSLCVGGIGDFEQIRDLCEEQVHPVIYTGRLHLSPPEIRARDIADIFAKRLGAHKTAQFFASEYEVMLLVTEVRDLPCDGTSGNEDGRDQMIVVRWDGASFARSGLVVLPRYIWGSFSPWYGKNPYTPDWSMDNAVDAITQLGGLWPKRTPVASQHRVPRQLRWNILKFSRNPAARYDRCRGFERMNFPFDGNGGRKEGGV